MLDPEVLSQGLCIALRYHDVDRSVFPYEGPQTQVSGSGCRAQVTGMCVGGAVSDYDGDFGDGSTDGALYMRNGDFNGKPRYTNYYNGRTTEIYWTQVRTKPTKPETDQLKT
jgi:hypothetical protein